MPFASIVMSPLPALRSFADRRRSAIRWPIGMDIGRAIRRAAKR
jgi:hypothetical protein